MTSMDKTNNTTGIKIEKTEVVKNAVVDDAKRSHSQTENEKNKPVTVSDKVDIVKHIAVDQKDIPHMDKAKDAIGKGVEKVEEKTANIVQKTATVNEAQDKADQSKRN